MSECIFCKIINGEIPADFVYRDERLVAFADINPTAPTHLLVVPTQHLPKLAEIGPKDSDNFGYLMVKISEIAREAGLSDYRVVVNNGEQAGQSVFHVHFHLLGGRKMQWPPG